MARNFILLVVLCLLVIPVIAQDLVPDYSLQLIQSSFSEDVAFVIVKFDVLNEGNDAEQPTTAVLNLIETGEQVAVVEVPPLHSGERHQVELTFPAASFAPNSVESFRASVGIGDIELATDLSVRDNSAVIQIAFPVIISSPAITAEAPYDELSPNDENQKSTTDALDQILRALNISLDRSDPVQAAALVGVVGVLVLLLLILIVILRLLFRRPPTFGNQQPPYANLMPSDISTIAGRRQQWHMHAQSSALPSVVSEGSLHVRKLPSDAYGEYFSQWKIVALRLSQYDMYGRVNRSQIMLPTKLVRRLNWISRHRIRLTATQMTQQLRPVAKHLSRQTRKRLNERTAGLPLVMDIRLSARHDKAQIWFELFRSQKGRWQQIDRWQAEMVIPGKLIYESFTYTLFGQQPSEMLNQYQKRLEDDLIRVLLDMFNPQDAAPPQRPEAPTDPHLQAVHT
ncbi:MAG: hypothetical protein R3E39_06910 [Anaerolineae bacterium]